MGVDCRFWVIPQQRPFRPDAMQVANLANSLRNGNWVPAPDTPGQKSEIAELLPGTKDGWKKPALVQPFDNEPFTPGWIELHARHELVLEWYIRNLSLARVQYPFVFDPYPNSGPPYFFVRLVLTHDYLLWTGENVMPFEERDTRCTCDKQLVYETGHAYGLGHERIYRICPECKRSFDPTGISCRLIDGWSGESQQLAGGLTFRIGLIVDCHKYFPRDEEEGRRFVLRPEFLDLWNSHIGVPFEVVTTFD